MAYSRLLFGVVTALIAGVGSGAAAADPADEFALTARIDELLDQQWKADGIEPVRPASDAEFLRRVSLDLTGVTPTVSAVRGFLDDPDPNKRTKLIDRLLESPQHAVHFARIWREVMLPSSLNEQFRLGGAAAFERWLEQRFAENRPYDETVRDLLETTGNVNALGPGLFYQAVEFKPEELAASTSRTFLGVQIQCGQCHDHPFDRWTQKDFWGFAAYFAQLRRPDDAAQFRGQVVDTNTGEVTLPETDVVVMPRLLDGTPLDKTLLAGTRRQQLSRWLVSRNNPWFARATVNRAWALLFGRGFVNPVDDFGDHNPPSHPELLNLIAADFAGHDFDMRRLLQILTRTRAYQLSSEVTSDAALRRQAFAAMSVKSLTADQIYDSLQRATGRRIPATGQLSSSEAAARREFLARFEAPTQQATEFQGGIPQALAMLNGQLVADASHWEKSDLLVAVTDSPFLNDAGRVEILFLAALSRMPTADERLRFEQYIATPGGPFESSRRLADLLWALINSSEFIVNH
ncbi:hypothetical protein Mal4_18240 [Maioricimonas rarisocia]|uniref:DUF1549 domain-containing protein n=1 Tax=Maioricimonas rarisocia TaxID=2528026 RepID=A0A517Z4V5_9PLAN|nr:DUF1549 and DUF1553 domain-containing protein [Maioricimonas rarisocia]QDU37510.1 hypothetical protein Mal4_18240 [Maioricimonas rarisocia]